MSSCLPNASKSASSRTYTEANLRHFVIKSVEPQAFSRHTQLCFAEPYFPMLSTGVQVQVRYSTTRHAVNVVLRWKKVK